MYVIDLEGNEYALQATSTKRTEINMNEELSMQITPTKTNLIFLKDITEFWSVVDHDGLEYKIIYFNKRGDGDFLTIDLKAIPVYIDDMRRRRMYQRRDESMTRSTYFDYLFNELSPDYFYYFDDFFAPSGPSLEWEGYGDGKDLATMFAEGLERYNLEYMLVDQTFILFDVMNYDANYMFSQKLNASNITIENDASEFYTYARGYGDYGDGEGGEDWQNAKLFREYTSPLAAIFGRRDAPPIKNGNIKSTETMDNQLKTLVDNSLKISVSAKFHDMKDSGYPGARPRIADTVPVIDERINFQENLRIVVVEELKDYTGKTIDIDVTLGAPGLVQRHQTNIKKAIKNVNELFDGRKTLSYDVLPAAVKRASDALLGALTELEITDQGIIARDPSNPDRLVLYNSAGLGVSTDGGNTFEDAITYLGVNTNLLTAGQIHTNHIRIIGRDNLFYWDGNELKAVNPNDSSKFVRLTSAGLEVNKGAIEITRPDGYKLINDGMLNSDFSVHFSPTPHYSAGVEQEGFWVKTSSTDPRPIVNGRFRRDGRYLKLILGLWTTTPGNTARMRVRSQGDNPTIYATTTETSQNSNFESAQRTITVDLGVPNGSRHSFYVELYSTNGQEVRGYVHSAWLEG